MSDKQRVRWRMADELRDLVISWRSELAAYGDHFTKAEAKRIRKLIADAEKLSEDLDHT